MTIEHPPLSANGYQLLPQATTQWVMTGNLMFQAYFHLFYSLLVERSL